MITDSSKGIVNKAYITGRQPVASGIPEDRLKRQSDITAGGFGSLLKKTLEGDNVIKLSKHAETRMRSRNINLSQAQMDKMKEAVVLAESKGVRDSLVLMDNLAFVVNVRKKVIVTASNSSELRENVFTNIDGAVIV